MGASKTAILSEGSRYRLLSIGVISGHTTYNAIEELVLQRLNAGQVSYEVLDTLKEQVEDAGVAGHAKIIAEIEKNADDIVLDGQLCDKATFANVNFAAMKAEVTKESADTAGIKTAKTLINTWFTRIERFELQFAKTMVDELEDHIANRGR